MKNDMQLIDFQSFTLKIAILKIRILKNKK